MKFWKSNLFFESKNHIKLLIEDDNEKEEAVNTLRFKTTNYDK